MDDFTAVVSNISPIEFVTIFPCTCFGCKNLQFVKDDCVIYDRKCAIHPDWEINIADDDGFAFLTTNHPCFYKHLFVVIKINDSTVIPMQSEASIQDIEDQQLVAPFVLTQAEFNLLDYEALKGLIRQGYMPDVQVTGGTTPNEVYVTITAKKPEGIRSSNEALSQIKEAIMDCVKDFKFDDACQEVAEKAVNNYVNERFKLERS